MLLRSHQQQQQQCLFIYAIAFLFLHVHSYTTTPTTTSTSTSTSNRILSTRVPLCAFSCAEYFLESQFPLSSCPDRSDITCFCKTRTHNGYTLGEGVLQCMLEFCSGSMVGEYGEGAYGFCDSVQGAVARTHSTITATFVGSTGGGGGVTDTGTATTTGTSTSGMESTTRSNTDTLATSAKPMVTTFQTPLSATGTGTATGTSDNTNETLSSSLNPSASTSTSANATSASDNGPKDTHSLNAGSVVGVSVASGLSGFFLIAALLFLWRRTLKRKQQQKTNGNHYFEIGGHMSEPPDFGIPPRRPTPGPRLPPLPPPPTPPPKSAGRNAEPEMSRLMSPFEPKPQPQSQSRPPNPAVVVTGVDGEEGYGYDSGIEDEERGLGSSAGRIGHAVSSNFDQDSQNGYSRTERAPSDLLPDKPESSGLYPEPLRWDRQRERDSRSRSEITIFEDEDIAQPRSLPGASSNGYPNFSGLIGPRPYPGRPVAGLPAHPRAMMYGFTPQNHLPPTRTQGYPMKPAYINPDLSVPSTYEAGDRSSGCTQSQSQSSGSESDDCHDDYEPTMQGQQQQQQDWGQPSQSVGASRFYSPTMRPWRSREDLDASDIPDSGPETHRISRHSGFFTPLSPVREVRTPMRIESPNDYSTSPAIRYPRVPGSFLGSGSESASGSRAGSKPSTPTPATPHPAREIVSRPRIVRQHDIKRVEIHRGKPYSHSQQQQPPQPFQSRDLNAVPPYSPDDFWYEPGCRKSASQESSSCTSAAVGAASAPTPTINRLSGGFGPPPVEKSITRKPMQRWSMGQGQGQGQHQLTPSRRGEDLILRVD